MRGNNGGQASFGSRAAADRAAVVIDDEMRGGEKKVVVHEPRLCVDIFSSLPHPVAASSSSSFSFSFFSSFFSYSSPRPPYFIWRVFAGFYERLSGAFYSRLASQCAITVGFYRHPASLPRAAVCVECVGILHTRRYIMSRVRKPFPVKASDTPSSGESVRLVPRCSPSCLPSFLLFFLFFRAGNNKRRKR